MQKWLSAGPFRRGGCRWSVNRHQALSGRFGAYAWSLSDGLQRIGSRSDEGVGASQSNVLSAGSWILACLIVSFCVLRIACVVSIRTMGPPYS